MMILKYELDSSTKSALSEEGDWWTLCYDTDAETFYVDHEWDRADPLNPARNLVCGIRRYSNATSWPGPGAEKVANGMARLKNRARASQSKGGEAPSQVQAEAVAQMQANMRSR